MSEGIAPTGQTGLDMLGLLTNILPGAWMLWAVSAVWIAAACCWAFFGKRGYKVISLFQGVVLGAAAGVWFGTAIEDAVTAGGLTGTVLLDALAHVHLSIGSGIGFVLGGLLFALTGCFWSRFFFLAGGGLVGMGLAIGFIRLFRLDMENPLLLVLFVLVVTAGLSFWMSYRFPVPYTGLWGGFVLAMGLLYPAIRLFAFIGGPSWLPVLAAGGMGVLLAIAGISFQSDRQVVEGQTPHYV